MIKPDRPVRSFIDDTGNDPKEFAFVHAGWVAGEDDWNGFIEDWQETLNKKPSIEYFKHHEAAGKPPTGQFSGWKPKTVRDKVMALAKVITRHNSYGIGTGVRNDVFYALVNRAVSSKRQFRSVARANRPYDFCFHSIIGLVLQWQVNEADERIVDFMFDEGDTAFFDCAKMYYEMREELFPPALKKIAGIVACGDDKRILPLQAADLLAGQISTNLRTGKPDKPLAMIIASGKKIGFSPIRWGDPWLTGFAELIGEFNLMWTMKMLQTSALNRGKSTRKNGP